jgi:hypothetical protein
MGGAWKLGIMLAAAACALALAACGGGGGSSTAETSASGGTEGTTAQAPGESGSGGGGGEKGSNGAGGGGGGATSGGGGSGGSESATGPGPKKGERSYAFRTPGGDNSIQEYGDEGRSSDRSEAESSIDALYAAISSGNWAAICEKYLSKKNIEQIELIAEKSPQVKGKSCAEVLSGLNQVSGAESPEKPKGGIASLRIEGNTAFAIYRGADGKGYALPLIREGGQWKLTALGPTPLEGP